MKKIRVLVVDDSLFIRNMLSNIINKQPDMEVVATAVDAYDARDKLVKLKPDVMTLDIILPKINGITFLKKVMKFMPIPVIIVSSTSTKGAQSSIKALSEGAIAIIPKPNDKNKLYDIEDQLISSIRNSINYQFHKIEMKEPTNYLKKIDDNKNLNLHKIIAIGASTGGTEAIKSIMEQLPKNFPPIVIAQHMPKNFTKSFAERLDNISQLQVKEASDGDILSPGTALVAPGDFHMVVRSTNNKFFVKIKQGPKVWHQRPAVDVLFNSIAKYVQNNAIAVILTGMGSDGAQGISEIKKSKGITIAQSEKTCVVFGMPKMAIDTGFIDFVEDLENIPSKLISLLKIN